MSSLASQITSLTIVYSTVYSRAHHRKHQRAASLAFVWEFTGDPDTTFILFSNFASIQVCVVGSEEIQTWFIVPMSNYVFAIGQSFKHKLNFMTRVYLYRKFLDKYFFHHRMSFGNRRCLGLKNHLTNHVNRFAPEGLHTAMKTTTFL